MISPAADSQHGEYIGIGARLRQPRHQASAARFGDQHHAEEGRDGGGDIAGPKRDGMAFERDVEARIGPIGMRGRDDEENDRGDERERFHDFLPRMAGG
jgi:hypothetical protein